MKRRMVRQLVGLNHGHVFIEAPDDWRIATEMRERWLADRSQPEPMPHGHQMFETPGAYGCERYDPDAASLPLFEEVTR